MRTFPARLVLLAAYLGFLTGSLCLATAAAQAVDPPKNESPAKEAPKEGTTPLDTDALAAAVGETLEIEMKSGTVVKQAKLIELILDTKKNELRSLSVTPADTGVKRLITLSGVRKISLGDKVLYELPGDGKPKAAGKLTKEEKDKATAEAEARRKEEWLERLKVRGIPPWPELTDEDQKEALEKQKEFRDKIVKAFPGMQNAETQHFLFTTNIPIPQMEPYVASLDKMYDMMCKLYRIKPGTKMFRGKALIVAFLEKADFARFEAEMMQHDAGNAYGLCHQKGDGTVVVSCYRGDRPEEFGHMLVHETSHGFIFRYKTPARVPSWVNEGMADYIGAIIVPGSRSMALGEKQAHSRMLETRSLGGLMSQNGKIEPWQYGASSSLNRFLVGTNQKAYIEFIEAMKEGVPWEEALEKHYGGKSADLISAYGKAIGIPDLKP